MPVVPSEFQTRVEEITKAVEPVNGFLNRKEIEFLVLLAATPTAEGSVLEIGSYHGKSTIAIAKGAELGPARDFVTVDPLEFEGALEALNENLEQAGVENQVEFHQMTSEQLGEDWDRPIRLLWIDGGHSYELKKLDLDTFYPHLADGAIVAFHDVLNQFEGPVRVFAEGVLLSDHFGAAGVCGSIGWAQYFRDSSKCEAYRKSKLKLYRKLTPLVPCVAYNNWPTGIDRFKHKVLRSFVPHRRIDPAGWVKEVA